MYYSFIKNRGIIISPFNSLTRIQEGLFVRSPSPLNFSCPFVFIILFSLLLFHLSHSPAVSCVDFITFFLSSFFHSFTDTTTHLISQYTFFYSTPSILSSTSMYNCRKRSMFSSLVSCNSCRSLPKSSQPSF